jgi:hypothetical protein
MTQKDGEPDVEETEQRAWWAQSWSAADKRLLMITLLGGLGANAGIVVVLALAVITAHGLALFFRTGMSGNTQSVVLTIVLLADGAYFYLLSLPLRRFKSGAKRKHVILMVQVWALSQLAVLGLGAIGYAAGVR